MSDCERPCEPHWPAAYCYAAPSKDLCDPRSAGPGRRAELLLDHAQLVALDRGQRRALESRNVRSKRRCAATRATPSGWELVDQDALGAGSCRSLPDRIARHRRARHRRAASELGQQRAAARASTVMISRTPAMRAARCCWNTRRRSVQSHSRRHPSAARAAPPASVPASATSLGMSARLTQAPLSRTAATR